MLCLLKWPLEVPDRIEHMHKIVLSLALMLIGIAHSSAAQTAPAEPRISVPDINGMAITLVKPAFPETAVVTGADGAAVSLRVVVDENGNPISAQCSISCHPMLKEAAELAAIQSKFKPLVKDGRPVKYEGILLYSFVVTHVNWYRFGTALESVRQFDNISAGPMAQILSGDFAAEKTRLLGLDAPGVDLNTRWKVIAEVESSLRKKLKGLDLWRFEVGMALRRVTFWTMAGERTDRAAMQKAIDALPAHIAAAPEGVSEQVITGLTALSKYRVTAEIPERELRQAINDLSRKIPPDLK